MVTEYQQRGIHLEEPFDYWAHRHMKLNTHPNPFDRRYADVEGRGIDNWFIVGLTLVLVEMKNFLKTTWISLNFVREQIIGRYFGIEQEFRGLMERHNIKQKIRIIVVSFLPKMKQEARRLLEQYKIRIIELGVTLKDLSKQAIHQFYKKVVNRLYHTKLYHIIKELRKPKPTCSSSVNCYGNNSVDCNSKLVNSNNIVNSLSKTTDINIAICKKLGLKVTVKEGNMNLIVTGLHAFNSFG